jgi:hypothetical protein
LSLRNRQHNGQNRSKMITLKNKLIRSLLTKLVTFRVIWSYFYACSWLV